jgi:5-methylthioadenosine/S-adenosylhomocysteine deaminase
VHAAFTCSDDTLASAAGLAADHGVGVHIHVAEGPDDAGAAERLRSLATDAWLLAHCVHLDEPLPGTVLHNPRSNMNNAVGYARPARFPRVALGTDGIGASMLEEFALAYVAHRADDVTATPDAAWGWLTEGMALVPEAAGDEVTWAADRADPWYLAFTTGVRASKVVVDGEVVVDDGTVTKVDGERVRARAWEEAQKLWAKL